MKIFRKILFPALMVQVLVDGEVKAEGTSSGTVLSGLASYNF
jgi:hypothetical protein